MKKLVSLFKTDTLAQSRCVTFCLAAVAAAFVLLFSLWTSPIYVNWYGCDASFFTLVGRGMLKGMVPYRDAFDLKGPYFFFIEALGQLIKKGHVGLFILQILALFSSLFLMQKTGQMFISLKKTLGVITFFLLAYISLLWGGNCLEEFTLPLNLLAIYLNTVWLINPGEVCHSNKRMYVSAAVTGLCFTVIAFSKITAGAPLIGMCIGVFIFMMMRKEYKLFGFYVLYFALGAFIGMIPLLVYFGYHGCILKMLYCTFIVGFKRSSDLSKSLSWELESKVSGVTFSVVFSIVMLVSYAVRSRKARPADEDITIQDGETVIDTKVRDICILLLPMSVVTYLALHLGDGFIYYFITGMPCMVLALIIFVKVYDPLILFKDFWQGLCWMLIFVFVYHYAGTSINSVKAVINRPDEGFQAGYYKNALDMGALIPKFERDKVFSFDIDMQWYEINDMLPCNKYMVNLQYFISIEPSIEQELFDYLEKTPPKWMICSNTLPDYLPQMDEIVRSKYDCIYSTDIGLVYLLRE